MQLPGPLDETWSSCFRCVAAPICKIRLVQIREKNVPPLHFITMRYAAYHMTTRSQRLASNAKDSLSGLHRPPVHSKLRSKEHMQCTCPPERWKSSTKRRFSCFPWASSALPTFRPYPGHVDASMRASEAPCSSKISVQKHHPVRHDQREPSAVLAHDEDETGE